MIVAVSSGRKRRSHAGMQSVSGTLTQVSAIDSLNCQSTLKVDDPNIYMRELVIGNVNFHSFALRSNTLFFFIDNFTTLTGTIK